MSKSTEINLILTDADELNILEYFISCYGTPTHGPVYMRLDCAVNSPRSYNWKTKFTVEALGLFSALRTRFGIAVDNINVKVLSQEPNISYEWPMKPAAFL